MNYYIDIQIKPNPEMRENVLLNQLYTKFHKTLSHLKSTTLGVSFPNYQFILGNIVRIHGNYDSLEKFQKTIKLGHISCYCEISSINKVPDIVKYRTISRKQTTMSAAKLRRLVKRGSISVKDIKQYKAKMFTQNLVNPYFDLDSTSNGHRHRRFIQFGALSDYEVLGKFDQFGLSKTATIPWF